MAEDTRVYVIRKKGRKSLYLMAHDPVTGKRIERSAGTADEKEAQRKAFEFERELQDGFSGKRITWDAFKEIYLTQGMAGNAEGSIIKVHSTFNMLESFGRPSRLDSINAARVAAFAVSLRKAGRTEETVASHLRTLKAALRWAHDHEMLARVPKIRMPKRAKGQKLMKGRPITEEEFDRMIDKTEGVVGPEATKSWKHLLRGLWWSGLRLSEALSLSWEQWADGLVVDTSGKYVMLRIPADAEKGKRNRIHPVAPEFAEMLLAVPEDQRSGFVFNPRPSRVIKGNLRSGRQQASRKIAQIGEAAGVVVDRKTQSDGTVKTSYASAHDLRRAFGFRWSRRVMPAVLKELMRHSEISTTMKFYVGDEAEVTAEMLYRAIAAESTTDQAVAEAV